MIKGEGGGGGAGEGEGRGGRRPHHSASQEIKPLKTSKYVKYDASSLEVKHRNSTKKNTQSLA